MPFITTQGSIGVKRCASYSMLAPSPDRKTLATYLMKAPGIQWAKAPGTQWAKAPGIQWAKAPGIHCYVAGSIPAVTPRYCTKKLEKCSFEHKKTKEKKL